MGQFLFDGLQRVVYSTRSLLQRQAFEPVCQGHWRYGVNVIMRDFFHTEIGCIGLCRPAHHDIAAMSVYVEFNVDECDEFGYVAGDADTLFQLGSSSNARTQFLFNSGICREKCLRRSLEAFAQFDDLNTLLDVVDGCDIDAESKAVGQLRT